MGDTGSTAKLSDEQRRLLAWMLRAYRWHETHDNNDIAKADLRIWGIHSHNLASVSRSVSASMSRSLRRLEERGLIQRRNQCSGDRYCEGGGRYESKKATHVKFTPEGRALAERLETVNSSTNGPC
jgi:hypothetical protein